MGFLGISLMEFSSIYSEANRKRFLLAAAVLIVAIAVIDWQLAVFHPATIADWILSNLQ